jgi:hypothetical protein
MDITKINGYAITDVVAPQSAKVLAYAITDTNFVLSISKINAYAIFDDFITPPTVGSGNMFMLF